MSHRTNGNGFAQLSDIWTRGWHGSALLILIVVLLTGCGGRPASASDPTPTGLSVPAAAALVPTNTVQPPMILFVTPPPVRAEEPLSPDSRNIPSVFEGINEYYAVQATLTSVDQPPPTAADPAIAARAVVQIRRCDAFGCETSAGSGVIIHPSGLILTAYHVLLTDAEDPNAARYSDFVIAMTENPRTAPQPRYRARLVASKADQDLALLTIDRTLDTAPLVDNPLALPALPLADVTTLFGGDLLVLGYPVTGSEAISYVPVGFRSFDDAGRLIVVDQALDPGNSGGPALLLQEGRFAIAGLVIRRRSTQGQLSQQGLVRAIDQFNTLTWTPRVPRAWGENVQAQTQVTDATTDATKSLQLTLTLNTIDLVGQPLRLLFYATDAATEQPWRPVGMNGPLVVWADVEPQGVIARQMLTLTVSVDSLGIMPNRLRFRALLWEMKEGNSLWADPVGAQAVPPANTAMPMPTLESTATATPQPTPTPLPTANAAMTDTPLPPTFTATPTPEPKATATLEPTPTLLPTSTATLTDTPLPPTPTFTAISPPSILPNANEFANTDMQTATVNVARLNLRTGPGTTYPVIKDYSRNTQVFIFLGEDTNGDWSKVRLQDGNVGWMASQFLQFNIVEPELTIVNAFTVTTPQVGDGSHIMIALLSINAPVIRMLNADENGVPSATLITATVMMPGTYYDLILPIPEDIRPTEDTIFWIQLFESDVPTITALISVELQLSSTVPDLTVADVLTVTTPQVGDGSRITVDRLLINAPVTLTLHADENGVPSTIPFFVTSLVSGTYENLNLFIPEKIQPTADTIFWIQLFELDALTATLRISVELQLNSIGSELMMMNAFAAAILQVSDRSDWSAGIDYSLAFLLPISYAGFADRRSGGRFYPVTVSEKKFTICNICIISSAT